MGTNALSHPVTPRPARPRGGCTVRRLLAFDSAFGRDFLHQRANESRTIEQTLDRAWRVLSLLPRRELTMLAPDLLDARHVPLTGGDDSG